MAFYLFTFLLFCVDESDNRSVLKLISTVTTPFDSTFNWIVLSKSKMTLQPWNFRLKTSAQLVPTSQILNHRRRIWSLIGTMSIRFCKILKFNIEFFLHSIKPQNVKSSISIWKIRNPTWYKFGLNQHIFNDFNSSL